MRKQRLEKLNKELLPYGIPVFEKLGDYKKGEFELTGKVISVYSNEPFFIVVVLEIFKPYTKEVGFYGFIHQRKFGVCVALIVNKQFVICEKQHRLPARKYFVEFPRGRVEDPSNAGLELLKRELPQLFDSEIEMTVDFVEHSRPIWEDTGIETSTMTSYIIGLECENINSAQELQAMLRARAVRKDIKPVVLTLQEANKRKRQGGLDDLHSRETWDFAKEYLRERFKIPII